MKNHYFKTQFKFWVFASVFAGVLPQLSAQSNQFKNEIVVNANVKGKIVPVTLTMEKSTNQTIVDYSFTGVSNPVAATDASQKKQKINNVVTTSAVSICDSITNILPQDGITTISYTGPSAVTGFLGGTGSATVNRFAEEYNTSASSATHIQYFSVLFTRAVASNPTGEFQLVLWDKHATTGAPNAVLATIPIKYKYVQDGIAFYGGALNFKYSFATPIAIPASKEFFIGVQAGQISTDTLAIGLGTDTIGNTSWSDVSGAWAKVKDVFQWTSGPNMGKPAHTRAWIKVGITDEPVTVTPVPAAGDTICAGSSVNFSATGTNVVKYQWSFPNGSITSSTQQNPGNVTYNNPGFYFYNIQGINSCGFSHSLFGTITVDTLPSVAISASNSICRSTATTISASGADSYVWAGSGIGGLTTTTVSINQTTSTTYSVTGTDASNGCTKTVTKTINIIADPTAAFSYAITDTICPTVDLLYNSSTSVGAVSYSWTFGSGTPATATTTNPAVAYSTSGLFNTKLVVNNGCGQLDSTDLNIYVQQCSYVGIEEQADKKVKTYFDASTSSLKLILSKDFSGTYNVAVYNALGQIITAKNIVVNTSDVQQIQIPSIGRGLYFVRISDSGKMYTSSFVH